MQFSTTQLAWIQAMLDDYALLATDAVDRCGSMFLRNADAPTRHLANHVRRVRHGAEDDIEAFMAALDDHYGDLGFRAVVTDWFTPPPIEARLLADGYECTTNLVLATDAPLRGATSEVDIRTVPHDSADLAALVEVDETDVWREWWALEQRRGDAYTHLVAFEDGLPVGRLAYRVKGVLANLETLFVRPEHRHRGLATALLLRADAEARTAGATTLCLLTRADQTAKDLYRRLGFEPAFTTRLYHRTVEA
ncbi:MAG: GNAT family N-acetyltransferase [Dehalococcoidia bacterium]